MKTNPDYRKQKYVSVRISKKAYAMLARRAAREKRTKIASLDALLGV